MPPGLTGNDQGLSVILAGLQGLGFRLLRDGEIQDALNVIVLCRQDQPIHCVNP